MSGYYSGGPYFFSKVMVEVLPNRILPVLWYGIVVYWMCGFVFTVTGFFLWMIPLFMVSINSGCLILLTASYFTDPFAIVVVYGLTTFFSSLSVGIFANLDSIPWVLRWSNYVNVLRYTISSGKSFFFKTSKLTRMNSFQV